MKSQQADYKMYMEMKNTDNTQGSPGEKREEWICSTQIKGINLINTKLIKAA